MAKLAQAEEARRGAELETAQAVVHAARQEAQMATQAAHAATEAAKAEADRKILMIEMALESERQKRQPAEADTAYIRQCVADDCQQLQLHEEDEESSSSDEEHLAGADQAGLELERAERHREREY